MKLVLVYNPKSGSSLPLSELRQKFHKANITISHEIDITRNFPDSLRPHIDKNIPIAAIGGDGTLNSVAQVLYDSAAVFVPLPGGTLNHFTKDAGIAQDLDEALANLATARPRKVDIATVNDRVFLNNSSIGIYPTSLRTRKSLERYLGKWPAAVLAMCDAYIRFKLYTVTIDNLTYQTPFIFMGNNHYRLSQAGKRTALNKGQLYTYSIASTSRRAIFSLLHAGLRRQLREHDEFVEHRGRSLTIRTRKQKVTVSIDGEVARLAAPLHYRCRPKALTILG